MDAPVITRPNVGPVRVDKVCVLSYQGFKLKEEGVQTRAEGRSMLGMKALPVHSSNKYLAKGQIWGIGGVTDEDRLKALVPVELKRHGYIDESVLEEIAELNYKLGSFSPTTTKFSKDHAKVKLNIAILQQAIRYGDHYGARFVMGSSYYASFILDMESIEVPGNKHAGSLQWAFVDRKHIRLAFAYIFWRACDAFRDKLVLERAAVGKRK